MSNFNNKAALKKRGPKSKSCFNCYSYKKKCSLSKPKCTLCLKQGISCYYPEQLDNLESGMDPNFLKFMSNQFFHWNLCDKPKPNNTGLEYDKLKEKFKKSKNGRSSYDGTIENKKCSYLDISLLASSETIETIKLLLGKSVLDKQEALLISNNGKVEYWGKSPFSFLVTFHCHLYGKKTHWFESSKKSTETPIPVFETTFFRELSLYSNFIFLECIDSFFDKFNAYFRTMDEEYFKQCQNPLLKTAVIAIGCKYLPHGGPIPHLSEWFEALSHQLIISNYMELDLEVLITLLLIGQYQLLINFHPRACYFQTYATTISRALGLHLKVPKKLHLSRIRIKARSTVYWASFNLDKLFAFSLNRQILLSPDESNIPISNIEKTLPILSKTSSQTEHSMAREHLSCIYMKHFSLVCVLMSDATNLLRKEFINSLNKSPKPFRKFITKINRWQLNFFSEMVYETKQQPEWVKKIRDKFILYLMMVGSSIVLQISHTLKTHFDEAIKAEFCNYSHHYAVSILTNAESLGEDFFQTGILYRLYCVFNATIELSYAAKSSNIIQSQRAKQNIHRGIKLIDNTRKKFEFANESYELIMAYVNTIDFS